MNTQPWGAARWPHRPLHEECSAPASSRLYKLTLGQNEKCKEDPHNSAVEQTVLTTQTGLQEARSEDKKLEMNVVLFFVVVTLQ